MKTEAHKALAHIEVSLDLNDDHPYVKLSEPYSVVDAPQEIVWEISCKSAVQDLRFFRESVHFKTNAACFIYPEAHVHQRSFRIYNTHTIKGDCKYTLMVEHEGRYYITPPPDRPSGQGPGDPAIHNR